RLGEVARPDEIAPIRGELADRFGPPPPAVDALMEIVGLRVMARDLGVERVEARGPRALLTFAPPTPVTPTRIVSIIAKSKGRMVLRKEYTLEVRIPEGPWPAVHAALRAALEALA